MAEDKYFGIAPENEADAEKQRAKQKRREKMIENMLKDEAGDRGMKMMLEIARSLQHEADGVAKAIESYVGKKEQPLSPLCILDLMHAELDVNALKVYLGVSWLPGEDDEEDDDLDDLPYGWDGPMQWDEDGEDEKGDDVMETLSDHLDKSINELFSAIVRLENDLQQMEVQKDDDAPTKDDCGECALLFPIPCTKNIPQVTVKDWFAKLDEEVNEWKEAVLRVETLHTPVAKLKDIGRADKARIAEEGADVSTVVASMEDLMDIDGEARADAQLHVNQHNKERGRW